MLNNNCVKDSVHYISCPVSVIIHPVYTACLSPIDVSNAVYVDESLTSLLPGDLLVMAYLNQWISEASEVFLCLFLIVDAYTLFTLFV